MSDDDYFAALGGGEFRESSTVQVELVTVEHLARLGHPGPLLQVGFRHNNSRWSVVRTPVEIWKLHVSLYLKEFREMVQSDDDRPEVKWSHVLLKHKPGGQMRLTDSDCRDLQEYLNWVLQNPVARRTESFGVFAEVGATSFINPQVGKGILEGYAEKRRGGRRFMQRGCSKLFSSLSNAVRPRFKRRWFVLRPEYLLYTDERSCSTVRDVILFDSQFSASLVSPQEGSKGKSFFPTTLKSKSAIDSKYICVQNGYRKIVLKFDSHLRAAQWASAIQEAHRISDWSKQHRFGSFAPPRENCGVKLLVDGEAYFSEVRTKLAAAQREIYIAGWWLVPLLPLVRNAGGEKDSSNSTVLHLLTAAANRGVRIFIVLYKEMAMALTLDAMHTKRVLESAHPNIRVILHPKQVGVRAVLAWSHHQKVVIVDHQVAFLGGLDLALGRFDRSDHRLSDPDDDDRQTFPRQDYCNPCIRDFTDVRNFRSADCCDRQTEPRLPWHDVHCALEGPVVSDFVHHFVQLWNHVKTDKHRREEGFAFLGGPESRKSGIVPKWREWRRRRSEDDGSSRKISEVSAESPKNLKILISPLDIDLKDDACSSDSSDQDPQDFVQSGVALRSATLQIPDMRKPSFSTKLLRSLSIGQPRRQVRVPSVERVGGGSSPTTLRSRVQLLRSSGWWSLGLPTDKSIQAAYCEVIAKSQKFIYIENQFFVTSSSNEGLVKNQIGRAIATRVLQAVTESQSSFKVYIVLPVMPAFENAQLLDPVGFVTRATLQLQKESLVKGGNSILAFLHRALGEEAASAAFSNHIVVAGLRQIDKWSSGHIRTEQLYVHSKAMVVDDRFAIIGSANINDRSMLGDRDSEIAVLIEDDHFARNMRTQLWQEHFGLISHHSATIPCTLDNSLVRQEIAKLIQRPDSTDCFEFWKTTCTSNAEVFRVLFGVVPDNTLKTRREFAERIHANSQVSVHVSDCESMARLAQLKGRLVEFQVLFLEAEIDLYDPMPTSATICPREVFC